MSGLVPFFRAYLPSQPPSTIEDDRDTTNFSKTSKRPQRQRRLKIRQQQTQQQRQRPSSSNNEREQEEEKDSTSSSLPQQEHYHTSLQSFVNLNLRSNSSINNKEGDQHVSDYDKNKNKYQQPLHHHHHHHESSQQPQCQQNHRKQQQFEVTPQKFTFQQWREFQKASLTIYMLKRLAPKSPEQQQQQADPTIDNDNVDDDDMDDNDDDFDSWNDDDDDDDDSDDGQEDETHYHHHNRNHDNDHDNDEWSTQQQQGIAIEHNNISSIDRAKNTTMMISKQQRNKRKRIKEKRIPHVDDTVADNNPYKFCYRLQDISLYTNEIVSLRLCRIERVWKLRDTKRCVNYPMVSSITNKKSVDGIGVPSPVFPGRMPRFPFGVSSIEEDGPLSSCYKQVLSLEITQLAAAEEEEDEEQLLQQQKQLRNSIPSFKYLDGKCNSRRRRRKRRLRVFLYNAYARSFQNWFDQQQQQQQQWYDDSGNPTSSDNDDVSRYLYMSLHHIPAICIIPYAIDPQNWLDKQELMNYCLCVGDASSLRLARHSPQQTETKISGKNNTAAPIKKNYFRVRLDQAIGQQQHQEEKYDNDVSSNSSSSSSSLLEVRFITRTTTPDIEDKSGDPQQQKKQEISDDTSWSELVLSRKRLELAQHKLWAHHQQQQENNHHNHHHLSSGTPKKQTNEQKHRRTKISAGDQDSRNHHQQDEERSPLLHAFQKWKLMMDVAAASERAVAANDVEEQQHYNSDQRQSNNDEDEIELHKKNRHPFPHTPSPQAQQLQKEVDSINNGKTTTGSSLHKSSLDDKMDIDDSDATVEPTPTSIPKDLLYNAVANNNSTPLSNTATTATAPSTIMTTASSTFDHSKKSKARIDTSSDATVQPTPLPRKRLSNLASYNNNNPSHNNSTGSSSTSSTSSNNSIDAKAASSDNSNPTTNTTTTMTNDNKNNHTREKTSRTAGGISMNFIGDMNSQGTTTANGDGTAQNKEETASKGMNNMNISPGNNVHNQKTANTLSKNTPKSPTTAGPAVSTSASNATTLTNRARRKTATLSSSSSSGANSTADMESNNKNVQQSRQKRQRRQKRDKQAAIPSSTTSVASPTTRQHGEDKEENTAQLIVTLPNSDSTTQTASPCLLSQDEEGTIANAATTVEESETTAFSRPTTDSDHQQQTQTQKEDSQGQHQQNISENTSTTGNGNIQSWMPDAPTTIITANLATTRSSVGTYSNETGSNANNSSRSLNIVRLEEQQQQQQQKQQQQQQHQQQNFNKKNNKKRKNWSSENGTTTRDLFDEASPSRPLKRVKRSPLSDYVTLNQLRESWKNRELTGSSFGKIFNIFGVVVGFTSPFRTRRGDWMITVSLVDDSMSPTTATTNARTTTGPARNGVDNDYDEIRHDKPVTLLVFRKDVEKLPKLRKVGDILRMHRVCVEEFNGDIQIVGKQMAAFVVFRRFEIDQEEPPNHQIIDKWWVCATSKTYTFSKDHKVYLQKLWTWTENRILFHPTINPEYRSTLDDLARQVEKTCPPLGGNKSNGREEMKRISNRDLTVMVSAIIPYPSSLNKKPEQPCGILRVWDGTGVSRSDPLPITILDDEDLENVQNDPPSEAVIEIASVFQKLQEYQTENGNNKEIVSKLSPLSKGAPKSLCGLVANVVIWEENQWNLITSMIHVGSFIRLRNTEVRLFGGFNSNHSLKCIMVHHKSWLCPLPDLSYEVRMLLEQHNERVFLRKDPFNPDAGFLPIGFCTSKKTTTAAVDDGKNGKISKKPLSTIDTTNEESLYPLRFDRQSKEHEQGGERTQTLASFVSQPSTYRGTFQVIKTIPNIQYGLGDLCQALPNGSGYQYQFVVVLQEVNVPSGACIVEAIVMDRVGTILCGMPASRAALLRQRRQRRQATASSSDGNKKVRNTNETETPNIMDKKIIWNATIRSVDQEERHFVLIDASPIL